jgi:hypothetical protein
MEDQVVMKGEKESQGNEEDVRDTGVYWRICKRAISVIGRPIT